MTEIKILNIDDPINAVIIDSNGEAIGGIRQISFSQHQGSRLIDMQLTISLSRLPAEIDPGIVVTLPKSRKITV